MPNITKNTDNDNKKYPNPEDNTINGLCKFIENPGVFDVAIITIDPGNIIEFFVSTYGNV
jgi:hypothetical protein